MQEFFQSKHAPVVVLSILGFFGLGIYVGYHNQPKLLPQVNLADMQAPEGVEGDFSPFWKVWQSIDEKYPDAGEVSTETRVYGAINGLIESFDDPYTMFFNPEETKIFEEDISGNFSGVGMEVGIRNKELTVIAPLKGTPAENAGLKSGDRIIKIDDTETEGISVEHAVSLIRGKAGTDVKLTVIHEGERDPSVITVTRAVINIPTLQTTLRDDGIFVIELYSFSGNSTSLFRDALREFSKAKTSKLILDLRGNPGGYLSAAIDLSSWFLPGGKIVAIEDFGGDEKQKMYRSKGYDIFNDNLRFVILIDGGSASASEIVAGAMQDYSIAKIVGSKSYGKGSVQEVVSITSDTILKVTVAKWLTPNSNLIDGIGLTPDYVVERTHENTIAGQDPQMEKAIEILNNWPK